MQYFNSRVSRTRLKTPRQGAPRAEAVVAWSGSTAKSPSQVLPHKMEGRGACPTPLSIYNLQNMGPKGGGGGVATGHTLTPSHFLATFWEGGGAWWGPTGWGGGDPTYIA